MSGKEDNNRRTSSVVLYESYKPPMSPPSSQPFIFQQYTVRETVTPTKLGNISMKEVSFSMCSGGAATTASAVNLAFSPSSTPKKQQKSRYLPMLVQNPMPLSTNVADSSQSMTVPKEKPHHLKHRSKNTNPFKKVKIESVDEDHKKSRSRYKHSTNYGSKEQLKESKELHWRYIFIISLLPLLVFLALIKSFWPINENILVDPLTDSAEEELIFSNLEPIHNALNQQVFGQEAAISSLISILDGFINKDMLKNKQMPVILLSGSSGVGKSFISSIVTDYYPGPGKSKLVHWPTPAPEFILKKFSESHLNLVVVDNINLNSITHAVTWTKKLFNEALWQNKPIIVMLSLNVQVWNDTLTDEGDGAMTDMVYKKLQMSGLDSHHIHLKVLSKEDVKCCIRVALQKRGLLNEHTSENHVTNISEFINSKAEGCKSVWNHSASVVF